MIANVWKSFDFCEGQSWFLEDLFCIERILADWLKLDSRGNCMPFDVLVLAWDLSTDGQICQRMSQKRLIFILLDNLMPALQQK